MTKGKLLIATPEITLGLEAGMGNLLRKGVNFSNGGMAPVNSKYILGFMKEGSFDVYATLPKWESSLRTFNELTSKEVKAIERAMPENFYIINHPSFNKVPLKGTNVDMYQDSPRFTSLDRALAFSSGVTNTVLPNVRPDVVWVNDWMVGAVAPVAKAVGAKVVTTGHNIFTQRVPYDEAVNKGVELRDFDDYRPGEWIYWDQDEVDLMATAVNAADDFTTVSKGFLERLATGQLDQLSPTVTQAIKNKHNARHPDGRPRTHGYLNPLDADESQLLNKIKEQGLEATVKERQEKGKNARNMAGLAQGGTLLIYPNRLYSQQKNPELLIDHANELANKYDLRILILANGEDHLKDKAVQEALNSNGKVAYHEFNKGLEEMVKQSDNAYGVMTSNYEPCGGPNLNYPLEGTLLIGHAIDGIKDTVQPLDTSRNEGNGFPYMPNTKEGLNDAVKRMKTFADKPAEERYGHYIRIAQSTLLNHSVDARVKQLTEDVFGPLYEEP